MWSFSAVCNRNNIGDVCITNCCKCVCNITNWVEEEILVCVVLRFKCIFELGFKLWTQSNHTFIVGGILVMCEIKRIFIQWRSENVQNCFDSELNTWPSDYFSWYLQYGSLQTDIQYLDRFLFFYLRRFNNL